MSFQIGDKVGDYQIIGVLGAGGMGRVYKVKNLISDRIDAMKVLLRTLPTSLIWPTAFFAKSKCWRV